MRDLRHLRQTVEQPQVGRAGGEGVVGDDGPVRLAARRHHRQGVDFMVQEKVFCQLEIGIESAPQIAL